MSNISFRYLTLALPGHISGHISSLPMGNLRTKPMKNSATRGNARNTNNPSKALSINYRFPSSFECEAVGQTFPLNITPNCTSFLINDLSWYRNVLVITFGEMPLPASYAFIIIHASRDLTIPPDLVNPDLYNGLDKCVRNFVLQSRFHDLMTPPR